MPRASAVYGAVIAEATSDVPIAQAGPSDPTERVGALFDAHHQRLYRLACRLSGNAEDARDLVQETFLRVARAPGSVPAGSSSEEAWLVRVLVNICRDRWRQAKARKRLDPLADSAPKASSDQEAALIARTLVWRALETLPPRRRAIVVMYELEGAAIATIAKQLRVRAVTVRWHLSIGRRELAKIVGGKRGDES
jgi:RNA polymerase sigma-70 factor (ECF subfamily)